MNIPTPVLSPFFSLFNTHTFSLIISRSFIALGLSLLINNTNLADGFGSSGNNPQAEEEPQAPPNQCNEGNGGAGSGSNSSSSFGSSNGGQGHSSNSFSPINFYSGRERLRYTDMLINGVYDIKLVRHYDSQSTYDSPLGYGWSFNHNRRLYEYPDNSVILRYQCGDRDRLVFAGGAYVPAVGGLRGQLVEQLDGTFIFTYFDGSKDYFDLQGRLSAAEDAAGNRLEYTYSATRQALVGTSPYSVDPSKPLTVAMNYQLQKIEERLADGVLSGNNVSFTYSPTTGRLSQATASDGRIITYAHDSLTDGQGNTLTAGNLVTVNGLENRVSTYKYEDPLDKHNATYLQTDAGTTPVINSYDSDDKVHHQVYGKQVMDIDYVVEYTQTKVTHTISDADGLNPYTTVNTYHFNDHGYTTQVDDAEGYQQKTILNSRNLIKREEFWSRADTHGKRTLEKAVDYTYDIDGHKVSQFVSLANGDIITHTWTYQGAWVASHETVSSRTPSKKFRTEYTFNLATGGSPLNIKKEKRLQDDGTFQVLTYAYNARQQRTKLTFPDGVSRHWEYLNNSLYPTRIYWTSSTGTVLPTQDIHLTYDTRGNLKTLTDARGKVTTYVYDQQNRLRQITNALSEETHYTYENNLLKEIEVGRTYNNTVKVSGQITRLVYNSEQRLTSIQRLDASATPITVQSFTYDSAGQRLSVSDALNHTTTYGYTKLGQLNRLTDANNNATQFAYDAVGRQTQVTDALNRITVNTYDALDRLIHTEQHGITPAAITHYDYDAVDNLIAVTDPQGNKTQYQYNTLSQKTAEIRPLNQTLHYTYDGQNRLHTTVLGHGQKMVYTYTSWGGLTQTDHYVNETATVPERVQTFGYDHNGNLTTAADNAIQTGALYTHTYDVLNRLKDTTTHYIPGGNKTLAYTYDTAGNQRALRFTDGATTLDHSYPVDALNRLGTVTLAGQTYTFDIDSAYRLNTLTYPNGNKAVYTYENHGPLKSVAVNNSAGTALETMSYTYDAAVNVDTYTDNDGLYDFGYDGLDRLTLADYPVGSGLIDKDTYDYDNVGNREVPGTPAANSYNANNQLTALQSGSVTFAYDNDGNQLSKTDATAPANNTTYTYDLNNRLITFSQGSTNASYGYGPSGRRLYKTVNGATTWFLWSGTQLLAEYSQTGAASTLSKRYDYLPGDLAPRQVSHGTNSYTVHSDHLETPKLLTDSMGKVVWRSVRKAFGETEVNEDVDGDGALVRFNVRFPGQYFDEESGLHYNYFRNYDPATGRYIQSDPIGLIGGINTYIYAENNSLTHIDPRGLYEYKKKDCYWPIGLKWLCDEEVPLPDELPIPPIPDDVPSNPFACTNAPSYHACLTCCTKPSNVPSVCKIKCMNKYPDDPANPMATCPRNEGFG